MSSNASLGPKDLHVRDPRLTCMQHNGNKTYFVLDNTEPYACAYPTNCERARTPLDAVITYATPGSLHILDTELEPVEDEYQYEENEHQSQDENPEWHHEGGSPENEPEDAGDDPVTDNHDADHDACHAVIQRPGVADDVDDADDQESRDRPAKKPLSTLINIYTKHEGQARKEKKTRTYQKPKAGYTTSDTLSKSMGIAK